MNKYGFLCGVNVYAEPGNDLNGCVNDIMGVYERLTTKSGFTADNIRTLADKRALQNEQLIRLDWLMNTVKAGDIGVWQNSSHGSQVRCRNGDELDDGMDEIICPHDMDWDNPFTDDLIQTYLKRIPVGAKFFFMSDSCHSGTTDRSAGPGNPHPIKNRYMCPPVDIALRGNNDLEGISMKRSLKVKNLGGQHRARLSDRIVNVTFINQNYVFISGCRDNQTSADAHIDGKYQGAMTAALLLSLKDNPASWLELHEMMLRWLYKNKYSQVPQLSGPEDLLKGPVFI